MQPLGINPSRYEVVSARVAMQLAEMVEGTELAGYREILLDRPTFKDPGFVGGVIPRITEAIVEGAASEASLPPNVRAKK